ncbi:MAG TPA: response regulator [Gemmata sp.]|jgi:CheY-like chemotaxis protein|nr:response regulator [Gemmata sp.]
MRLWSHMTGKPIRILNVDDNEVQRYTTTRLLASAGFEVIEACNAQEALRLATNSIDLVFLDVDLPDIDGFELTRILKSQTDTAGIPIIQASAVFAAYSHMSDGLHNGAQAYFTFPLDADSLIRTVRNLTNN